MSSEFKSADNKFIPSNLLFFPHVERTRGIQLYNHMWSKTRKSDLFLFSIAMASQFTASEHLNGPGQLQKNVSKSTTCELHRMEQYLETLLGEINVFQA